MIGCLIKNNHKHKKLQKSVDLEYPKNGLFYTLTTTQPAFTSLKLTIENIGARCEMCSKLTIRHQKDANDAVLVSLLLTLNM